MPKGPVRAAFACSLPPDPVTILRLMRGTFTQSFVRDIAADFAGTGILGIGPKTSTALTFGAFLTASYAMGATWLGAPIVYLPLGGWLLAGSVVGAHLLSRRFAPASLAGASGSEDGVVADPAELVQLRSRRRESSGTNSTLATAAAEIKAMSRSGASSATKQFKRLTDRLQQARAEITIGLDLPKKDFDAIHTAGAGRFSALAGTHVSWLKADPGLVADGVHDAEKFDALIRRGGDGTLTIFTRADAPPHTDGAVEADLAREVPNHHALLSYASVFPTRLDCHVIRLNQFSFSSASDANLAASLGVVAAVLSRARRASISHHAILGAALPNESAVLASAMSHLGDAMIGSPKSAGREDALQAAARVLSAFVSTGSRDLPSGDRTHLAQAALDTIPDDPELALRLGAAQIGDQQNAEAKQTLVRALRQLRSAGAKCECDPLAFVMSEAEHGASEPLTLGRICAGIALAWGTTHGGSLDYLRDDLIDDLKYSGWLAGREDDVKLLREVIAELENELLSIRPSASGARSTAKKPSRKRKAA